MSDLKVVVRICHGNTWLSDNSSNGFREYLIGDAVYKDYDNGNKNWDDKNPHSEVLKVLRDNSDSSFKELSRLAIIHGYGLVDIDMNKMTEIESVGYDYCFVAEIKDETFFVFKSQYIPKDPKSIVAVVKANSSVFKIEQKPETFLCSKRFRFMIEKSAIIKTEFDFKEQENKICYYADFPSFEEKKVLFDLPCYTK